MAAFAFAIIICMAFFISGFAIAKFVFGRGVLLSLVLALFLVAIGFLLSPYIFGMYLEWRGISIL